MVTVGVLILMSSFPVQIEQRRQHQATGLGHGKGGRVIVNWLNDINIDLWF